MKKKKILTLSDHPLFHTGVAIQTRLFIESMLQSGEYKVVSLAGALKHESMSPVRTEQYGDQWEIYPVENYGSEDILRSAIRSEKPDVVWIMTDPRYWSWLWQMENEIRSKCSLVYYHVWDNYPAPHYNKKYYDSNDCIVSASKLTEEIINEVGTTARHVRIPHTYDESSYKELPSSEVNNFKKEHFGDKDKTVFLFNNRNIQRKNLSSLLWWFKSFLNKSKREDVSLLIHTDPQESTGVNVEDVIKTLGFSKDQVMISPVKYPPDKLAMIYNAVDCTINISEAEGFGLSTLESLACGTPILVTNTGGLKEQVTDGENKFGISIEPSVRTVVGSQSIPYIYQDRISEEQFVDAMEKFCSLTDEERKHMGTNGMKYVQQNYSISNYSQQWKNLIDNVVQEKGSWSNRNHKGWEIREI